MNISGKKNTLLENLRIFSQKKRNQIALSFSKEFLTYPELERDSSILAKFFQTLGVSQKKPILFFAEKKLITIIAFLATWKCESFFIPINPKDPERRIAQIIKSVMPGCIIGEQKQLEHWEEIIPSSIETYSYEELESILEKKEEWEKVEWNQSEQNQRIAYCLYKSGFTGVPKGVMITHGALQHYFYSMNKIFQIKEDSRCLNISSFYFDVFITDTLIPLFFGATVYLTGDFFSPPLIIHMIKEHKITHFCAISSLLKLISYYLPTLDKAPYLETILSGVEKLNPDVIEAWLNKAPDIKVINGYGTTETVCACMAKEIRKKNFEEIKHEFPIGTPLSGMEILLYNPIGGIVSQENKVGELLIYGPAMISEYHYNEEENQRAFIVLGGKKYYRTGDLGVFNKKKEYLIAGKVEENADVVVKGYEFHLNEVKKVIESICNLYICMLIVQEKENKEKILVAAISCNESKHEFIKNNMFTILKENLPEYMVPEKIRLFGVTPFPIELNSGKIDKKKIFTREYEHLELK